MKRVIKLLVLSIVIAGVIITSLKINDYLKNKENNENLDKKFVVEKRIEVEEEKEKISPFDEISKEAVLEEDETYDLETPIKYIIPKASHTYQTFNNCGPATLSITLSHYGINVSQEELGNKMRPYQHPKGDNDDKTN